MELECCCCWSCYILLLIPLYYLIKYFYELPKVRDLSSKAVLITGCDSGLGRMLALKCAEKGMTVFAGCTTKEGEESLKSEGDETKGSMRTVRLDVTSQESVQKAVVFTEMHLSGGLQLWALVNNAGFFALNGPDDWCSLEDYDQSLKVNTLGHIRVVHAFRHLLERSKGRIVTVTSATTRLPLAGACAYTVAQSAIEAYTNALRHEVRPFGITCHIIELGVFRTDFIDSASLKARLNTSWEKLTHKKKAKYGEEFKDDYIASVDADIQKRASSCLNCAVNTYYHSITARNPRLRYRCGFDAHFANFISYLPSPLAAILNAKNARTPGKPSVLATTSNEKNSDKKEQ